MNLINNIKEKQNEIIMIVNTLFDELIKEVSNIEVEQREGTNDFENILPLTNTKIFKGKKPIAVIFGENRIITPTWKVVVETIFKEVLKEENMKEKLYSLSDKVLGRKRTRLSKSPDEMRKPLKLEKNLYIETHYDTETLMNLLLQILNDISYNYNDIKVAIKN